MKRLVITAALLAACGDDGGDDPRSEDAGTSDAAVPDAGADANGASACSELTYANFGKGFIDTYCVSCHGGNVTGGDRNAAPVDKVFDTIELVRAERSDLKEQVVTLESMPFGVDSIKPSDEERVKFGRWLDCGAN